MKLSALYQRFNDRIWGPPPKKPGWRRRGWTVLRVTVAVVRDIREANFDERASSLSYNTLLSLAPLLAVIFSILKAVGVRDVFEPFLRGFLRPLGGNATEAARWIASFVDKIQISVLGTVGIAFLLYSVWAIIGKVEQAFNDIWRVRETRSFFRLLRDYVAVLLIGPVLLLLSMGMTAALHEAAFIPDWLYLDTSGNSLAAPVASVPYLLFMLAFTAMYMLIPNTRVPVKPALIAGLITGITWKLLGRLFAVFVAGSASYAAIYSAFAALALLMIWVYAGWMTVLAGASLCYYLQHPSNLPLSRKVTGLSGRFREKAALQLCAEIGRAFYKKEPSPTLPQLATHMRMPSQAVQQVASDLVQSGMLAETGDAGNAFIPKRDFDATTVDEMLEALRGAGEGGVLQSQKIHGSATVDAVLKIHGTALHDKLGKITLKQLALGSIET